MQPVSVTGIETTYIDLHCMSDDYLADDLLTEHNEQQAV